MKKTRELKYLGLKHCGILLAVSMLAACAQTPGPSVTSQAPPAEINVSQDTVLFARTVTTLNQQNASTVKALVFNGAVLLYGTTAPQAQNDQLRQTLEASLNARAVHWFVSVMQTPTPLPFQHIAALTRSAEQALASIPGVNTLNFRQAVSDTGQLYVIGRASNASQKKQIVQTLSSLPDVVSVTEVIDHGAQLF